MTGGGGIVVGTGTALGTGALNVTGAGGTLGTSVGGTVLGNAVNLDTGVTLGLNGSANPVWRARSAVAASRKPARAQRRCSAPTRLRAARRERRRVDRGNGAALGTGALHVSGVGARSARASAARCWATR